MVGYIHDAILESNQLEDEEMRKKSKNEPSLKRRQFKKKSCVGNCNEGFGCDEEIPMPRRKHKKVQEDCSEEEFVQDTEGEEELRESASGGIVDIEDYLEPDHYIEESLLKEDMDSDVLTQVAQEILDENPDLEMIEENLNEEDYSHKKLSDKEIKKHSIFK